MLMKLIEEDIIELTMGLKTNSLFARTLLFFKFRKQEYRPQQHMIFGSNTNKRKLEDGMIIGRNHYRYR